VVTATPGQKGAAMTSTPCEVYAGIDWLSMTTGDSPDADAAYARARALAVEQTDAGDRLRPWSSHGYKGFGTPHLRCGVRDADVLVELSGPLADRYWQEFVPLAKHVTRVDTQVTCTYSHEVRDLALQAYHAPAVVVRPGLPPIRKALFQEANGGQTLYLGAPTSTRRARLYDKSAESGGEYPPNTWRYEVQERSPLGGVTVDALRSADDVPRSIAALVHALYRTHGIEPWFNADRRAVYRASRPGRRDLSRWLEWLQHAVRPGVCRWSDRETRTAILRALGLDDAEPGQ